MLTPLLQLAGIAEAMVGIRGKDENKKSKVDDIKKSGMTKTSGVKKAGFYYIFFYYANILEQIDAK